jgi:aminocarboxymuconate-semialdehyde decarboxylase
MLDLHTHVVPASTPFLGRLASADPRWARLETGDATGDVLVAGNVFRTVKRVAWDLTARREAAEAAGGTGQLLSAMPELLAPWAPPQDAADYARAFNDWLATEIGLHGGFFTGLGIVPLADPDVATAMLEDIAAAGLLGVELPSQPPGAPLHGPRWAHFLDEAQRLGLLIFIHAVAGPELATYPHPMAANGVLFPAGIGTAIGGLIATGALASRPELRILVSHGGGSLMTELPRIDFLRNTNPALQDLMTEPAADTARRLWFDPMLFDANLVQQLARIAGPDRIVYGTDYPFMAQDPLSFLDGPAFTPEFAAAVRGTNPAALLALLTSSTDNEELRL